MQNNDKHPSGLDIPVSRAIWADKYRFKGESSIYETRRRVAKALATAEPKDQIHWENDFFDAMAGFKFIPAGRVLAGAGTGRKVTLFNCFVLPTIPDSMDGIFSVLKAGALTMQQGGGIGTDFSTLRPKGALVQGVGADASGPLSFMDCWDAMCRTIMSAGSRRGAMMGTLRCDHPDIEAFVDAKLDRNRFRNFNLSVLITDPFMAAVQANGPWDLVFKDKVYQTVSARALFDKITRNTYDSAEPGVIFIDRINAANNLGYAETIACTNPCFAADTLITTKTGAFTIEDLAMRGLPAQVWDGARWVSVNNFRITGHTQQMLRLTMQDGSQLRVTPAHSMILVNGERKPAGQLCVGDELKLHNAECDGEIEERGAYIKGFLAGDGSLKGPTERPVLYLYEPKYGCRERLIRSASEIPSGTVQTNAVTKLGFTDQFTGRQRRKAMAGLTPLKEDLADWCGEYKERLPNEAFRWSRRSKCEFLAGLFDADGTVRDSETNGFGYQLASIHANFLRDVQTLLKTIGIASKLGIMRSSGEAIIGGTSYSQQDCWRLSLGQAASIYLAKQLDFERLPSFADRQVKNNHKSRAGQVVAIEEDGIDELVYCCTVPETHAVSVAIGITTGNCSEQPLPPNGACLLGSINLAALVKNPFTAEAGIDPNELGELTAIAVRMLDNVIDISGYPLPEQKTEATLKRRIGLGITGLGSALAMCGWHYGSSKGRAAASAWMRHIARSAYTASIGLAQEKGPFPLYDPAQYRIAEALEIETAPLRNSHLVSIAPTGTISLLAGNVSSGIEPIFDWEYQREVLQSDGSKRTQIVEDFAVRAFRELHGPGTALPEQFRQRAGDLTPEHHLMMQSVLQPFVDSAISKTINCPKEMPFEAFKRVYYQAYELGLKGVATYRPNDITGSVLATVEEKPKPEPKPAPALAYPQIPATRELAPRPEALPGKTYKLRWPANDAALYVTINSDLETRRPFEIFISSRNLEFATWTAALTRLISGIWRRGGDTHFVIEELRAVHDPRGGAWIAGAYVPSVLAAIGNVIERHCIDLEEGIDTSEIPEAGEDWFKRARLVLPESQPVDLKVNDPGPAPGRFCPRCSSANVREKPGCLECRECGFSNCS